MGKGIALEFKRLYPDMFQAYRQSCKSNQFHIGDLLLYKSANKWILNFPTKAHWRQKSKLEYIEAGLDKFVKTYEIQGIQSISFPLLGCGYGDLDWETQVRPIMESYLDALPVSVFIHFYKPDATFQPTNISAHELQRRLLTETKKPAFADFWLSLCQLIGEQTTITDIETHTKFRVSINSTPTATIQAELADHQAVWDKDQFADLWQRLHDRGYLMATDFPSALKPYGSSVVSLLAQLEHLHPVMLSNTVLYDEFRLGLQIL